MCASRANGFMEEKKSVADSEHNCAIEQLYGKMYKTMCIYAESVLRDSGFAEEAVQDVFQIACAKPDDVLNSKNPEGWLMITLKYVIQNMKRRQMSLSNLMIKMATQSDLALDSPESAVCFDAMCEAVLGESDYRLIKRVVDDRYTMLEAAGELGITVHACKKRVQRAKQKLKKQLKKEKIYPKPTLADVSIVKGGKCNAGE